MQFSNILAVLALGTAAVSAFDGFSVPEGTQDGVYSVYRRDDGSEVHEPVDGSAFGAKFAARDIPALPLEVRADRIAPGTTSCGKNEGLNAGDTDAANADLDRQCGGWTKVKKGHNFYSIRGGVVAYFCNYMNYDYGCSNGIRKQYAAQVTTTCGAYKPGEVLVKEGMQGYGGTNYAYGYGKATDKFCGCGTKC